MLYMTNYVVDSVSRGRLYVTTWRQFTDRWVDAGASSNVVKPWCDPLRVRAGEQLRGRLPELEDLRQHGDPLLRFLDASEWRGRKHQVNDQN